MTSAPPTPSAPAARSGRAGLAGLAGSYARQAELLDEWVQAGRQIAALEARRSELLAERLDMLAEERSLDPHSDELAFRSMCAEYAAAGHLPPATVGTLIPNAWALVRLFPQTWDALASGTISKRHADVIVTEAPNLSGHPDASLLQDDYQERVLAVAKNDTAARTRVHARAVAATVHPETTTEQHHRARSERSVTVTPDGEGMAVLTAILPELLAYAVHDRLTAMAGAVIQARPEGHRRPRQSVLAALRTEREQALTAQTPSDPEPPPAPKPPPDRSAGPEDTWWPTPSDPAPWERPPHPPPEPALFHDPPPEPEPSPDSAPWDDTAPLPGPDPFPHDDDTEPSHDSVPLHDGYGPLEHDTRTTDQLRADILTDILLTATPDSITTTALESITATIHVTISAGTLTGHDDTMAELTGHGPLTPEPARTLAGHATSWERVFLDPRGMVTETDNYVPTSGMKRFLRARDQHCRFPGCRAPAHRCHIDHNHDHAQGGPTTLGNLSLFCIAHHTLKHPHLDPRDRWSAQQLHNGTILWTSPLGRTYTDEPPLRVMFT